MDLRALKSLDFHRLSAPNLNDKIERMKAFCEDQETVVETTSAEEGDNVGPSWFSSSSSAASEDEDANLLSPASRFGLFFLGTR